MSSEMDKFILQYSVELKDAVEKLQQLNEKVKDVKEETKKGQNEFVDFSKKATEEVGKLIPGVDKVSGAVRIMTGEFAIAAVAVSALAIGVKSVMTLREQYGAQRIAGMATGVSGLRMEEYQRKFVRNSGGNVSRELAQEQIQALSNKVQTAYADPTRNGNEARIFRMLGVQVGQPGKGQTGFNDAFGQLATKFSQMTPEKVQGVAKAIGMNEDFALALQKIGPSITRVTEMTAAEVQKRQESEAALKNFNKELGLLQENFNNLEISLGQRLIPAFNDLIELINKAVNLIPKTKPKIAQEVDSATAGTAQNMVDSVGEGNLLTTLNPAYGLFNYVKQKLGMGGKPEQDKDKPGSTTEPTTSPTSVSKPGASSSPQTIDAIVAAMDKSNDTSVRTSTDMQMAINMFSGAVATFANAIDERQAWAAWAGEAGRAAGLSAPAAIGGSGVQGVSRAVGSSDYDHIFEREARGAGVSVDLLKRIAKVESNFNPNAKSEAGAEGLMQIMPANKKGLGIKDSFDPEQNIRGGAALIADFLKRSGGNVREALMMYHGGLDKSNWGPRTNAYPDKVLGDLGAGGGGGESKQTIARRLVQQNIANRLGVPLEQLQQGQVNRGDVSWAAGQLNAGVENGIFSKKKELMNAMLPQSERAKIMNELREQQTGLQQLNQYSPGVIENARPGDRSITIGENAIMINVLGNEDPAATAREVQSQLDTGLGDLVNHASSGVKY